MPKFRKKPVVIDAMQFVRHGEHTNLLEWLAGHGLSVGVMPMGAWWRQCVTGPGREDFEWRLVIKTLEGDIEASPGDWIIRGVEGEFYPCKPSIFAGTYEPA